MVLRNLVYNNIPAVVHCPGRTYQNQVESWKLFIGLSRRRHKFKVPPNLACVTWNSRPEKSILEAQFSDLGNELSVLGSGISNWNNGMKGLLLAEYAQSCNSEYILAMDALDVCIQGDLSCCIEELERRKCDVLFGGEDNSHPPDNKARQFEASKYASPWCHLNSGLMIARREFIAGLRDVAWEKSESDQRTWKRMHLELWPRIQVDDHCRVFQNINHSRKTDASRLFSVVFGVAPVRGIQEALQ